MTDPIEIIRLYNRLAFARGATWAVKRSDSNVKSAQDLIRWCAENGIDPLSYTEAKVRHSHGRRKRLPKFVALKDDKFLPHWDRWYTPHAQERADQAVQASQAQHADSDLEALLRLRHEPIRAQYTQGRQALCLARISDHGGFHPESQHCARCPLVTRCATRTNEMTGWDVVGARQNDWRSRL